MPEIKIDDKNYNVTEGKNLLETCLSLGMDLPYFCWHPKLGSVGACRQCAVKEFKDENDDKGKIIMACMESVKNDLRISLKDPEAVQFRAHIIESLMTNHPHDCPTCDEGGECHLQDMTVMTGHNYRRFRFNKRTFQNQDLGPFINHEMNRCITCYRCVRFYRDFAGGRDLDVFAAHNHAYFGRFEDGPLENEFSGNLVEICPTGVFTDKTLKQHYTRKWDLTTAPSICNQCSLGCNTIAGERYGNLRRILSRYNGEVNGYFICDRGRFGYEYMNTDQRITKLKKRNRANGEVTNINVKSVLEDLQKLIKENARMIGVGSPRASIESNFALKRLVGENQFFSGMSENQQKQALLSYEILRDGPARTPSLREIENADAVLVLGEDLTNTAPMMALALRQSVRQQPLEKTSKLKIPQWNDKAVREGIQEERGPLFLATTASTKLDEISSGTYYSTPEGIAQFGFAIAHAIDPKSPDVSLTDNEAKSLVEKITRELSSAKKPVIIGGSSCGGEAILKAASNIARALVEKGCDAGISIIQPEANSMGLTMLGGKSMNELPEKAGDVIIILENDLYRMHDNDFLNETLTEYPVVIVLDYLEHETGLHADYVLPAAPVFESNGTLVNNEGRAQRYYQAYIPDHPVQSGWRWIQAISSVTGIGGMENWDTLEDFTRAIENELPVFRGIHEIAPPVDFRIGSQKIPREPHRYSGRTAMNANVDVHEPQTPVDPDNPMSYSMEGFFGEPPSSDIPFFWSPGWNSVQSMNKYQIEVGGHLHGGDPGKRLIEPHENGGKGSYYQAEFQKSVKDTAGMLVVPLYHIFGSEELSSQSNAILKRIPQPYLAISLKDASESSLEDGMKVTLKIADEDLRLPVEIKRRITSRGGWFASWFTGHSIYRITSKRNI